ncbi:MAG: molybdopterin-dependent oxidoreductase [Gemmatimonadaceae bacterium]
MSETGSSAGVKRRDFLKVLGVSGAATAAVGCSSGDVEKLIPYLVSPDQTVPGVSNYYATTCRECAAGCGLIVEVRDGRAIKAEGNPEHPVNRGALCARGQSSLQGLYNPDRYRQPMKREGEALVPTTWDDALQILSAKLGEVKSRGQGSRVAVVNQHEQGSFPAFLDGVLSGFGIAPHLSYDAEAPVAVLQANKAAYGASWPAIDFAAASLIVSFGADFLDGWGLPVPQQLAFAEARGKVEGAPRFIYVGARRSLTGLNADQWIPAKPGSELAIVNAIAGKGSAAAAAEGGGGGRADRGARGRGAEGARQRTPRGRVRAGCGGTRHRRRRAEQGARQRRQDHQAHRGLSRVRGRRRARRDARARRADECRRGADAPRPPCESGLHHRAGRRLRRRDGEGAVQGLLLQRAG